MWPYQFGEVNGRDGQIRTADLSHPKGALYQAEPHPDRPLRYPIEGFMNVPPYVPQPIEIPGNVAEEAYLVRLTFLRRVVALYAVSILVVWGSSLLSINVPYDALMIIGSLLLLSAMRGLAKGRPVEQKISLVGSVALFVSLGALVHKLLITGWPVWMLGVGCICLLGYVTVCGRDLSFTGMWFLSLVASSVVNVVLGRSFGFPALSLYSMLLLNAIYLSYWVYDLAALQTRRRLGEEIGAVLDLYRDVLNMFSYPIRVMQHWRRHKIWSARS
jgi:hypothetical protein